MKDQFVIFFGQTQTTDVDGEYLHEEQATLSAIILVSSSTIQTIWNWLP